MLITAMDNGRPVRTGEARVILTVKRNQFPPAFSSESYTQTVSENVRNGTGIFTVRATDQDLQGNMVYEIVGISPAPLYFHVNPTLGTVWVKDDLKKDRALQYTVSRTSYIHYTNLYGINI